METTRRSMLMGAAAVAAVATAGTPLISGLPARAAAPPAGKQAPGFYRYKVGDYEVTIVNDGVWLRPLEPLPTPNASAADLQKALSDAFLPINVVPYPFNLTIINTGSKLIAIDTGTAGRFTPTMLLKRPAPIPASGWGRPNRVRERPNGEVQTQRSQASSGTPALMAVS